MKLALGCSFSTLLIVLGVLAAILWGGMTYVTLTSEEVRLESAWARLENASLHRIDLANELLALAREAPGVAGDEVERLAASLARTEELVASPRLLSEPEALEGFEEAQGELAAAVSALLEAGGARLDRRSPEAMQRLREQYAYVSARVAEAGQQLDLAADSYNRQVTGFPHRAVAALLGFDGRVFPPAPQP